jgi:very-short-patch-repair endonuclease
MPHQTVTPFQRAAARSMRSRPVDVEKALWWRLRGRRLRRLKFRRQHPIGRFIADFACLEARLVVELDGRQHQNSLDDIARSEDLYVRGFAVLRFPNEEARKDIDAICAAILQEALTRIEQAREPERDQASPLVGEAVRGAD